MNLEAITQAYAPRSSAILASRTARTAPSLASVAWATAGIDPDDLACLMYSSGLHDYRDMVEPLVREHLERRAEQHEWRSGRVDGLLRVVLRELPYGAHGLLTAQERAFMADVSRRQWYAQWKNEYDLACGLVWARAGRAKRAIRERQERQEAD